MCCKAFRNIAELKFLFQGGTYTDSLLSMQRATRRSMKWCIQALTLLLKILIIDTGKFKMKATSFVKPF
jgi:hypothetical protein